MLPSEASGMLYTTTFTFYYAFHAVFHSFCAEFRREKGGGTPIWATCVFVCLQSCVFFCWGLSHDSNREMPGFCTAQGVRKASSRVAISALNVYSLDLFFFPLFVFFLIFEYFPLGQG